MSKETGIIICKAVSGVISTLVLGEVFGGAVSRPIRAWRLKGIDGSQIIDALSELDQRISDLEEERAD